MTHYLHELMLRLVIDKREAEASHLSPWAQRRQVRRPGLLFHIGSWL